MDKLDAASDKVSSAKRRLEAHWGNLKHKMTSISLLGDAHYFDESKSKLETLRKLLDNKNEKQKLEAMKTITAMMTLGRDMSSLFPDVVKCVVVDNMEVKKLVYRTITFYARENKQLALLAISSLQKDQQSPNQLIRGKAMQCMSSLEVPNVLHLTILSLKSACKDSSPYVRKICAHALPRIFRQIRSNDGHRKECEEILESLLNDVEVMVLSSAMYAFLKVCPEHYEILHPHFRKLCHLLADMEPWGQIVTLTVLTRYGRHEFVDPNKFREDMDSDEEAEYEKNHDVLEDDVDQEIDPDHRLLLKSAKNLMYSMNGGVMMAVTSCVFYLAPYDEFPPIAHNLLGHLGRRREIDYCILANIAVMAAARPDVFQQSFKRFFINGSEPVCNKRLKMDILSRLATETNITALLREFRDYVRDDDVDFRCATMEAMGRCADQVPEVAENILRCLMQMADSNSQIVIASAVVVMRQIIQRNPEEYVRIIKSLIILLDRLEVPEARAAVVWLIGEYRELVPQYTLDVLRKLCKSFRKEDSQVKLQTLNLAVKLFLFQSSDAYSPEDKKIMKKLFKYVLDLCKFDKNYDVRDRCRIVRTVFLRGKKKGEDSGPLSPAQQEVRQKMQQMFLADKPIPKINSPFKIREQFSMGTLSLQVMHGVRNYVAIEDFPEDAPMHGMREQGQPVEEDEDPNSSVSGDWSGDGGDLQQMDYDSDFSISDDSNYNSDDDSSDYSSDDDSSSGSGTGDDSDVKSMDDDVESDDSVEFSDVDEVVKKVASSRKSKSSAKDSKKKKSKSKKKDSFWSDESDDDDDDVDKSSSEPESSDDDSDESSDGRSSRKKKGSRSKRNNKKNSGKKKVAKPVAEPVDLLGLGLSSTPTSTTTQTPTTAVGDDLLSTFGFTSSSTPTSNTTNKNNITNNDFLSLNVTNKNNTNQTNLTSPSNQNNNVNSGVPDLLSGIQTNKTSSNTGSVFDDLFSDCGKKAEDGEIKGGSGLLFDIKPSTKPPEQFKMKSSKKKTTNISKTVQATGCKGQVLNHTNSKGLQVDFQFCRTQSELGKQWTTIRLEFTNKWNETIRNIKVGTTEVLKSFPTILRLEPEMTSTGFINVKFATNPLIQIPISTDNDKFTGRITAPPGELMVPVQMTSDEFRKHQKSMSGGMTQSETKIGSSRSLAEATSIFLQNCNVAHIEDTSFRVGETVVRRGDLCDITSIDYQIDPPACTVRLKTSGTLVNTEFNRIKKADLVHSFFAARLLRDNSLILFEIRGKQALTVKVHCQEFMFITQIADHIKHMYTGGSILH